MSVGNVRVISGIFDDTGSGGVFFPFFSSFYMGGGPLSLTD